MVDVFDEVEEQLRSERYKSIALRVLPILGGVLVVALVAALAVWGYQHFRSQAAAEASSARKSQVRTVDRSERVRTYNFPENRIADHRVNYKAHNLDAVLDGDLDAVVEALTEADLAARLSAS